jgi:hypothetical protein
MQFGLILVFNEFGSWSHIPVTGGSSEWILLKLEGCERLTSYFMVHCRVRCIALCCYEYEICEYIIWREFTFQTKRPVNLLNTKSSTEWGDHCARICRVLRRRDWGMCDASNVWRLGATRGEASFCQEWILFALSNFISRLLHIVYNILKMYKLNEKTEPKWLIKCLMYVLIEYLHFKHRDTALNAGRSRLRFPLGSLGFINYLILMAAKWRWGRRLKL